jgi:hypothetical protein
MKGMTVMNVDAKFAFKGGNASNDSSCVNLGFQKNNAFQTSWAVDLGSKQYVQEVVFLIGKESRYIRDYSSSSGRSSSYDSYEEYYGDADLNYSDS